MPFCNQAPFTYRHIYFRFQNSDSEAIRAKISQFIDKLPPCRPSILNWRSSVGNVWAWRPIHGPTVISTTITTNSGVVNKCADEADTECNALTWAEYRRGLPASTSDTALTDPRDKESTRHGHDRKRDSHGLDELNECRYLRLKTTSKQ